MNIKAKVNILIVTWQNDMLLQRKQDGSINVRKYYYKGDI